MITATTPKTPGPDPLPPPPPPKPGVCSRPSSIVDGRYGYERSAS